MSRGWSGVRCAAVPIVTAALATVAGCGGGGNSPSLPPDAAQGREIIRTNGCSACHGTNGEGGVGPAFTGLYGSQVALADGSTTIADEAYLTESIRDPSAAKVAGFGIDMPSNDLDDAQIASVIAYIRALSTTKENS